MPLPAYRRERIDTPDGDFLDLDWCAKEQGKVGTPWTHIDAPPAGGAGAGGLPAAPPAATPLVVLFHGLEGSSASHYARALMHAVVAHGWHGVVVHFRGCSGEPNRLPRAYHSGDSAEIGWILQILRRRHAQVFATGVSLGGNALLKWLGEQGKHASGTLQAAAAVSVPYDLAAADRSLTAGLGRVYARHFLHSLVPRALAKARRFPGQRGLDRPEEIRAARTLRQFDDAVTAPLHGFRDADAYYAHSSSGQYLNGIVVPTLLLHARNDPFLPPGAIPHAAALPAAVELELSVHGGHAGFVDSGFPGRLSWLPQRLLTHFAQYMGHNRVA